MGAAIIKRLKVTDCHSSIAKQLAGRCKSEKDHMDPNEAYRSDRKSIYLRGQGRKRNQLM